ncbi:hypothetical protein CHUAL_012763 [Chamberlinius hualienensis]
MVVAVMSVEEPIPKAAVPSAPVGAPKDDMETSDTFLFRSLLPYSYYGGYGNYPSHFGYPGRPYPYPYPWRYYR